MSSQPPAVSEAATSGGGPRPAARRTAANTTRPPTPWWAALLAIAGVTLVVTLLAAVVGSLAMAATTSATRQTLRGDGVSALRLVGPTGGVDLSVDETLGDRVVVELETTTRGREARVRSSREDGELVIEVECVGGQGVGWPWAACGGQFDVRLGPETDLAVDLGTGGVRSEGGPGPGGDVTVTLGAGGIQLDPLRSPRVDLRVGTGGIDLGYAEAPVAVVAEVGLGGVGVELPEDGEPYAVTADVGVGGVEVTVPRDRTVQRSLELSTGVGGVWVRHPEGSDDPFSGKDRER